MFKLATAVWHIGAEPAPRVRAVRAASGRWQRQASATAASCGYTTLRCSTVLPEYSTSPPPDGDTEISKSSVAGAATVPSTSTSFTTVRFVASLPTQTVAATGCAWLPARLRMQTQGALRKYR